MRSLRDSITCIFWLKRLPKVFLWNVALIRASSISPERNTDRLSFNRSANSNNFMDSLLAFRLPLFFCLPKNNLAFINMKRKKKRRTKKTYNFYVFITGRHCTAVATSSLFSFSVCLRSESFYLLLIKHENLSPFRFILYHSWHERVRILDFLW